MASSLSSELRVKGYAVVSSGSEDYSFDFIAAKQDEIVAIKLVERFDSKVRRAAEDLKRLGKSLDLAPLLVCHEGAVEDSLSTYRGIPSLSYETLRRLIKGEEVPFIYFSRGGVYVKIRGEVVKAKRRERGMSLGELAYSLGVTRRMAYEYETGRADATLEVASRLVRMFGDEVVEKLSFKSIHEYFSSRQAPEETPSDRVRDPLLKRFLEVLDELGYTRYLLERAPFQIAAGKHEERRRLLIRKAERGSGVEDRVTVDVARVCRSQAILVTEEEVRVEGRYVIKVPSHALEEAELKELVLEALSTCTLS